MQLENLRSFKLDEERKSIFDLRSNSFMTLQQQNRETGKTYYYGTTMFSMTVALFQDPKSVTHVWSRFKGKTNTMEMKLDIVKTIKRLSGQGQNDILKNKLREWLQTKAFTLSDLLSNCREGTFQLSGGLLNKLGSMYSSGADGLTEDCSAAYTFFEMAAELGHAGGNANCAQYYFDGLAPGGKNNELALIFCSKAIELGLDKHMLMAEILFDMQQYAQAVEWLQKILSTKGAADRRRRTAARQLERQCLVKQLNRVFYTLHTSNATAEAPSSGTEDVSSSTGRAATPTRSLTFSTTNVTVSPTTTSMAPSSIFFSANTPRSQFLNDRLNSNIAITTVMNSPADLNTLFPVELAGWVSITDELDGFDRNACAALTTQAEWLELEVQSARAGFESAQMHILSLRRNNLAEDIVSLLESTKVSEYKSRYETMVNNKNTHLACWEEYTNTQEHILRRQINTEQAFFSAHNSNNKLTQYVATELLKLRTVDETAGERAGEPLTLNLVRSEGVSNATAKTSRIPTARCLITAERSLLDLAIILYPVQTYQSRHSAATTSNAAVDASVSNNGVNGSRSGCDNNVTVLRSTGWTAVDKPRQSSNLTIAEPITITPTPHNTTVNAATITHPTAYPSTPTTPLRSSTPRRSPLHSASMSNLRISTIDSPMNPPSDGYTPTPKPSLGGFMSPTASSAKSGVTSVTKKATQSKMTTAGSSSDSLLSIEPPSLFTPAERIVIDNTLLTYRCCTTMPVVPNDNIVHFSGYTTDAPLSSDQVLSFFNHLTLIAEDPVYAENERILSQIIQRFMHDGVPIQLLELQRLNADLIEADKSMLTKVVYHYFIRRVVRWLIPVADEDNSSTNNSYGNGGKGDNNGNNSTRGGGNHLAVPLASIHARALKLIEQGILTFAEAFDRNGLYGVFYFDEQPSPVNTVYHNTNTSVQYSTHSEHVPPLLALRNKCKHINALYQKYIAELTPRNFLPTIRFWKEHTAGATVPTYKLLYSELTQLYGGESDDSKDVDTRCNVLHCQDTVLHALLQKLQSN